MKHLSSFISPHVVLNLSLSFTKNVTMIKQEGTDPTKAQYYDMNVKQ